MNLPFFSHSSRFCPSGTPKVFRIFGGCGTRPFCSSKKGSDILAVPVLSLRSTGISSDAQAALAKISIRKFARFIFSIEIAFLRRDL
jgi:hypothetical protein